MDKKIRKKIKGALDAIHTLFPFGIALAFIVLVIGSAVALRMLPAAQTPSSIDKAEDSSVKIYNTDQGEEWIVYRDETMGVEFQYPESWQITEFQDGEFVTFFDNKSGLYINLRAWDNDQDLSPLEFTLKQRRALFADSETSKEIQSESTKIRDYDMAVVRFPKQTSNLVTVVSVKSGDKIYDFSLTAVGEIGGFQFPSEEELQNTEQMLLKVVEYLQVFK